MNNTPENSTQHVSDAGNSASGQEASQMHAQPQNAPKTYAPTATESSLRDKLKKDASFLTAKISDFLQQRFDDTNRFMLICAFTGVVCGLVAVSFHLSISGLFALVWKFAHSFGRENVWWILPLFPTFGGLIVGISITTFAKSASGSGIPQTKDTFYNNFGIFHAKDIVNRFILGTIFCGLGNSVGREGPTVHICSATASVIGQKLGLAKPRVQALVPVGMGAGIAAAFNAPLSAISFVFEELLQSFRTKALSGILVAVVIAAAIDRVIMGENPIINLPPTTFVTGWWMLVCIPLALVSGFMGDCFLKALLALREFFRDKVKVPKWLSPAIGGLAVGILATVAYYCTGFNCIFSVGYDSLLPAFRGEIAIWAMFMLFVFKFISSMLNYSMGCSGGLFSPTLVIGGMLGGAVGGAFQLLFGLDSSVTSACVMLGMGTCFASIIRCPLTSILMIFELTLNYSLILPLIVGNVISFYIANKRSPISLYNALLLQDKITLKKMDAFRGERDWKNLPVSAIMTFGVISVSGSSTPKQALDKIVSAGKIHRAYPVVDDEDHLLGMVTDDDLKLNYNSPLTCRSFLASDQNLHLLPTASIRDAANYLINKDVLEAPVIARENSYKLAGIVTLHDIARQQNAVV